MILLKPAKLDPMEWEIMKQHTVIGAKILKGSDAEFIKLGETIARTITRSGMEAAIRMV